MGAELFRADGRPVTRTDTHDKGNSRFPRFYESAVLEKTIGALNQDIRKLTTGIMY